LSSVCLSIRSIFLSWDQSGISRASLVKTHRVFFELGPIRDFSSLLCIKTQHVCNWQSVRYIPLLCALSRFLIAPEIMRWLACIRPVEFALETFHHSFTSNQSPTIYHSWHKIRSFLAEVLQNQPWSLYRWTLIVATHIPIVSAASQPLFQVPRAQKEERPFIEGLFIVSSLPKLRAFFQRLSWFLFSPLQIPIWFTCLIVLSLDKMSSKNRGIRFFY
jgi:hypothetical protein